MYKKTTGNEFLRYGQALNVVKKDDSMTQSHFSTKIKSSAFLYHCDKDVTINVTTGMALVIVSKQCKTESLESFVYHGPCKIHRYHYFNVVALTDEADYTLTYPKNSDFQQVDLSSAFTYKPITAKVVVDEIYAYYYSVKSPQYRFDGEIHEYYEMTFIETGSLRTRIDGIDYYLNSNDVILYGPEQFHDQEVTSNEPCSYLTVMFKLTYDNAATVLNRVFHCSKELYDVMTMFIAATEADSEFSSDLMLSYLQELIVHLLQYDKTYFIKPVSPIHQHFESALLQEITTYIQDNLETPLPIDEICHEFSMSRSSLQNLFKENLGVAPKQYINEAKLKRSKVLIKTSKYTISQIANMLGFNSIHYFSRKFTQRFNLTPSEYAKKIYSTDDQ